MHQRQGGGWAAVVGDPIGHSLSPALHRRAYELLGSPMDYSAFRVPAAHFTEHLQQWIRDDQWRGLSVTMPLKAAAFAEASRRTPFAEAVGVANTLWPEQDGNGDRVLVAHNTDVGGIVNALRGLGRDLPAVPRCAVLGGGGTATAAVAAARVLGARSVDCFVRSPERAGQVQETARHLGLWFRFRMLAEAAPSLSEYELVVCTLPARAFDPEAPRLAGDLHGTLVLDVSYDPWPSLLAQRIQERGGAVASGKDMLLHQALDQVKLFTGAPLTEPLPEQSRLLAAMAEAIGAGIPERPPLPVHEAAQLFPDAGTL